MLVIFSAGGHIYSRKCQRRQLYVSFRDLDWQVRHSEIGL